MLLAGAVAAGAQSAGPPEYGYGTIPFGNTAQQIIRELSGATIEEAGSEAHFINHYEVLPDFFAAGLEPDWLGIQQQLNVDVTRMYRVSYVGWINVVALELFFYREHDAPDELGSYRLFMVRKTLKTAGSGSHTEVSNVLTEAIDGRLGRDPVSYDVKFVPGLAARISKWEMADSDIFLLVFQNAALSSAHPLSASSIATASSGDNTWQRTARKPASRPVPPAAASSACGNVDDISIPGSEEIHE